LNSSRDARTRPSSRHAIAANVNAALRALSICASVAMLARCGGLQPPIGATGTIATHVDRNTAETVLYSFAGGSDGQYPAAAPISVGGAFYGTTAVGGNGGCQAVHGCGTVYKLSASGQESTLYVFKGGKDGEAPKGLIDARGDLIGTTTYGGTTGCKSQYTSGCGTVFELTPSGKERVLYRFPGNAQGALPASQLTLFKGDFYGEASAGGTGKCSYTNYGGCGVIFKMSRSGRVSIVYTFKGGKDPGSPVGGLVLYKGAFYGTTSGGGSHACYFNNGCGTVFKITPSGSESTLYKFTGYPKDGALPDGLAIIDGVLYGATYSGGKYNCGLTYYLPCGTAFKITLAGQEQIIYDFKGLGFQDGSFPNQLTAIAGDLYGTTQSGGTNGKTCDFPGCGTVFRLAPYGQETILYSFKRGDDGSVPGSGLIDVGGTLYGTTGYGGTYGDGTVFAVTP
jgi:uncharacterized repeat protein (TIGR03803 family)